MKLTESENGFALNVIRNESVFPDGCRYERWDAALTLFVRKKFLHGSSLTAAHRQAERRVNGDGPEAKRGILIF